MTNWKKPKPSFYDDLKFGIDAEARFFEKYGTHLERLDGKTGDFKIKGTNFKIENKTDRYSHDEFPNFIMEKYRSAKRPGGPFQALEHGCRYFCYWFAADDKLYTFDVYQLCRRITMLVKRKGYQLETIENSTYTTSFYRIPRSEFTDIALDFNKVIKRKYELGLKRKPLKVAA